MLFFFNSIILKLDAKFSWFWSWVNDNCPMFMNQLHCQRCNSASTTMCSADEATCYSKQYAAVTACPYDICRYNILSFLINNIT